MEEVGDFLTIVSITFIAFYGTKMQCIIFMYTWTQENVKAQDSGPCGLRGT